MISLKTQFQGFWNELKSKMGVAYGFASLDDVGRLPYSQLPESAMEFKGSWNAETNTPDLTETERKINGSFYIVSNGGTFEEETYDTNDRIIYDGSTNKWVKLPAGQVSSVNGLTGPVFLTAEDIEMGSDDATKIYDSISKSLSATGNVVYKHYNTYADLIAGEDFSSLPNGMYFYCVISDELYPKSSIENYSTIYAYLAYKDRAAAGVEDWDEYEWNTETVQAQADMSGDYFLVDNLATGKTATASSGNANLAVDGNTTGTRWESETTDPQWIAVDLGAKSIVESIGICWEAASAATYEIQFSNDGENWTTVQKCSGESFMGQQGPFYKKITLQHASLVRYIRIYGTTRTTQYGYSIWELGIYGKGSNGELQIVGTLLSTPGEVLTTESLDEGYLSYVKSYGKTSQQLKVAPNIIVSPGYNAAIALIKNDDEGTTLKGGELFVGSLDSSGNYSSSRMTGFGIDKIQASLKEELRKEFTCYKAGDTYIWTGGSGYYSGYPSVFYIDLPKSLENIENITATWTSGFEAVNQQLRYYNSGNYTTMNGTTLTGKTISAYKKSDYSIQIAIMSAGAGSAWPVYFNGSITLTFS